MINIPYFFFLIRSALEDFRRSKIRTFLTSLGIFIGVTSVILLLALGLGLQKYIENQFKSLGSNLIMVTPGKLLEGGFSSGATMMGSGSFDNKDMLSVKKIPNIKIVAPMFVKFVKIASSTNTETYEMIASTPDIFPLMNLKAEMGNTFTESDYDSRTKVVVLGATPAKKLFPPGVNPLGKSVTLQKQKFQIIGILKSQGGGGFGGPGIDDHVYIPHASATSFNPSKKFWGLYAKVTNESLLPQTKNQINQALLKRYAEDDFTVNDQREFLNVFNQIFGTIQLILVGIAAISLIVGGVGIMNIMFVSVAERTREIGIRRSFGATTVDILLLFLIESTLLSLLGGILALVFCFFLVSLVKPFFPAYINLLTIAIALGVSSIIGIVFGLLPAERAARLSPVEAIRYE